MRAGTAAMLIAALSSRWPEVTEPAASVSVEGARADARAEGHVKIDRLVPVRVPHPGAARVPDVQRIRVDEPIVTIHTGRNATFRGLPGPRGLLRPPEIGLEFFLPGKHDIVEVAARTPAYYKRFRARICGTDVLIPPPCVGTSTWRARASRRTRRRPPTRPRSG